VSNQSTTTARSHKGASFRSLIGLNLTDEEIARFYSKIVKKGPADCWPWSRPADKDGYGPFLVWREGKEIRLRAHRVAFFLYWGIDPEEYRVCHECDNPICCNPACLFSGADADNSSDKVRKGRQAHNRGEGCGRSRLTESQVKEIRKIRAETKRTCLEIGAQFGVSEEQARRIINRERWAHI